ncbi:MAG TPA: DMT family transporter [Gemmatimonadaceae bacterium]|jgi:Permeases of the drug/metabolite transporter (DMT) superfamily
MASPLETSASTHRGAAARDATRPHTRPGASLTDLLLLVTSIIWGVNYSVVKYGTGVMDPLAYNGARVALAALVFSWIAWGRRAGPSVSRRDMWTLLALGVLGNGIYQLLFAVGVAHTRAGSAAIVLASAPVFIALLGRFLGIERVGLRGYGGVLLSIAGIALVIMGGAAREGGDATLYGNLIVLVGAFCWALFTVLLEPFTHRVSLVDISALTLVGGAIPLLIVSAPAMLATRWTSVSPLTWAAIAYSGIGSLVIAYLFWYRGVRVIGPTRTAIYSNLQPVIALLVSWMLLSEVPTAWQGVGAATIIAGVILTRS